MRSALLAWVVMFLAALEFGETEAIADDPKPPDLFRRDNLVAWCIVPFDGKKRGPEERAAMLARLGLRRFAYDYRAEHVPTFDAEIAALKKHNVSLDAWWFPTSLNDEAKRILDVCRRNGVKPQLWVTGGGGPAKSPEEQAQRVTQEAARLRPIAEAAAAQGMKVGLYNHGGWFGEPENQIAIIEQLKLDNVGIVYNLHHGHDHLDRLPELLKAMRPHLLAFNLNGMSRHGDRVGRKILQLGQGELDLAILRMVRDSGYAGPIGILGHTQDDAEARLQDNLDGLDWILPQLDGKAAGPRPQPRTPVPNAVSAVPAAPTNGYFAAGRAEYRTPPLTVELRATLRSKGGYNILVASDTKASAAHWEIFSMAGTGMLTVYVPGMNPDHVRTGTQIVDGRPHDVGMIYEADRIRLYVDGKEVANQPIASKNGKPVPGDLAFGRLVEGGLGCDGTVHQVRLSRGARMIEPRAAEPLPTAPDSDDATIGLWRFAAESTEPKPQDPGRKSQFSDPKPEVPDLSSLKNPARRVSAPAAGAAPGLPGGAAAYPPPGPQLRPVDPSLRAVLVDRSPDDVYLGVKVDSEGCVFVGGREAVFVFEPTPAGDYRRSELLRFPPNAIIMGLEFRGNDLYVLASNALYLVPDGRVKRDGLQPQRILWGLPLDLHVSFHCLAWGPDGNLYLNHGDPLLQYGDWSRPDHWGHWTLYCGREGKRVPFTGQGAVLRVKPDGTDLHVVANGLRGPVGLAFTPDGHLFTNDNDHESRAEQYAPSRLLHVIDGIDFGWPRGWMASKSPERFDLVEPMTADLGRGVPCDLTWCDEPGLPESFRQKLLMCRWDRSAVTAYPLQKRGVSFSTVESTVVEGQHNARPVGIAVGRGGRLFVTSLFMSGNQAAPDCVSELVMLTRAADPPTHPFEPYDVTAVSEDRLRSDAASPSWERRHRAQQELLRRGAEKPVAWGAAPAFRSDTFKELVESARSDDTYARQLAVNRLARTATLDELERLTESADERTRLASVLAMGRRLTVPDVHSTPPESLKLFYPQGSAFFHAKQRFHGSANEFDPSQHARVGSFTTAQWWAAVDRTPEHEWMSRLLRSSLETGDGASLLQSAHFLRLLNEERLESAIASALTIHRSHNLISDRRVVVHPVTRAWTVGPFSDGEAGAPTPSHPPDRGPIDLTASYESRAGRLGWIEREAADGQFSLSPGAGRWLGSTYLYFQVQSAARQHAVVTLPPGAERVVVLHNGTTIPMRTTIPEVRRPAVLLDLQPGSNDLLLRAQTDREPRRLSIDVRAIERLEIVRPDRLGQSDLAERLRAAVHAGGNQPVSPEFLETDWTAEATKGSVTEGRRLFGALACAKCHAIAPDQKGNGAPSLADARKRFTVPQLVESILLPSRQIAEPFRGTTLALKSGEVLTGLVTNESAAEVDLLLPDATRRAVKTAEIDERSLSKTSPMPQGLVKAPAELRDLLTYLLSERPVPP